jgi:hypothetical protein
MTNKEIEIELKKLGWIDSKDNIESLVSNNIKEYSFLYNYKTLIVKKNNGFFIDAHPVKSIDEIKQLIYSYTFVRIK